MAYFPNGSAGMDYEAQWCDQCVHQHAPEDPNEGGCHVWLLHLLYNYDAVGEKGNELLAEVLDTLIPEDKSGRPIRCTMFYERTSEWDTGEKAEIERKKREWLEKMVP